jgi:3-oxoacyl-[acyl-carrier protein] reductase
MTNKVAVITGAARGLGKETALAFYEKGYRVVVNYHSSEKEAEELAGIMGDKAFIAKADVSSFKDAHDMARQVLKKWGRADALINNAGMTRDSLLIKQREEEWDRIMAVNLKGAFNCIKAFAPLMKNGGHIINISSYSGLKGKEGQAAYSASKAALIGLTKSAAVELAEYKIKVNALLPGYMKTEMGMGAKEAMKRAEEESLLQTLASPKEAARFMLFLAGSENITGQVFCLDSRIV